VSCQLIVAPAAEADLRENFQWYEQRSPGLGLAFLTSIEAKLDAIAAATQIFRKRVGHYRLATPARFPFAIYFIRDEAAALITVRRIIHFKQDRRPRL
jgi:toxin ParE1/3/4